MLAFPVLLTFRCFASDTISRIDIRLDMKANYGGVAARFMGSFFEYSCFLIFAADTIRLLDYGKKHTDARLFADVSTHD